MGDDEKKNEDQGPEPKEWESPVIPPPVKPKEEDEAAPEEGEPPAPK